MQLTRKLSKPSGDGTRESKSKARNTNLQMARFSSREVMGLL